MSQQKDANRAVGQVLRRQYNLITRQQALLAGMTEAALRHKLRADGPWRIVLPGVYLSHNGLLTGGQREAAAVLYVGRGCVITGQAALARQGVRVPLTEIVDVLIPHHLSRQSVGFVRVHRTIRMPDRPVIIDGIRWAPVPRAVGDAARGQIDPRDVRAFVAHAVQRSKCSVPQLATELRAGPDRSSAALRQALAEVADGVASVAEGDLRGLVKSGGLPEPMYNPSLFDGSEFLGKPDAWWRDAGVAAQVDSKEWHLSPEDWERTLARHAKMSAHGILVLHFTPGQLRARPAEVIAQLRSALEKGRQRSPLPIRTVPAMQAVKRLT
jgi:hypothetical protein